jgi:putative ABC transport system ATP-binding protein
MTLLELQGVTRRHRQGSQEYVVLRAVSLEVDAGELVAVWGPRRCGRSTLLRIAAGIERPDEGSVRFGGADLSGRPALGSGIAYCRRGLRGAEERRVLDELLVAQLARGVPQGRARTGACAALERVDATDCSARALHELSAGEAVRVALARGLVQTPTLLLVDDPIRGVDLLERDPILALLRSLADEGIAVLACTDDATGLSGADRALSLSHGELRGESGPELASVVPLRRHASA